MKIVPMSVELIDHMGSDNSVVDAARVSFSKHHEGYTEEANGKLISYLAKHEHWSPFAHTSISLRLKVPIFVARQLAKHQVGAAWNEVSRRYVDDEPEFYLPEVWRGKPVNAKQGSDGVVEYNGILSRAFTRDALHHYNFLLNKGIAPEQARMVLPQNTMTEFIWTGSLYFFARVCQLRLDSHAQKECQDVAHMINDICKELFPVSWKALLV